MKKESQARIFTKWITKIAYFFIAMIALGSAINSLLNIAREYTKEINDLNFISNWLPVIALAFFALGWLTTDYIEVLLLKRHFKIAGIFAVVLLLGVLFGSWIRNFTNYAVLLRFSTAIPPLILGGAFLRYSIFRDEIFFNNAKVG